MSTYLLSLLSLPLPREVCNDAIVLQEEGLISDLVPEEVSQVPADRKTSLNAILGKRTGTANTVLDLVDLALHLGLEHA